jgi:tetratricopeptide (TPR) repeat protein
MPSAQNQFVIDDLKREIVVRPDDAGLRFQLGDALFGAGEFQAAIKQLEKALSLDGSHNDARRLLVRALGMEHRMGEAVRVMEQMVQRNPEDLAVRDELIDFFMQIHHIDDALLHAQHAARVDAKNPERHMCLGDLFRKKGLLENARTCVETAHRLAPENPEIADYLRKLYLDIGDAAAADRVAGARDRSYFVRQARQAIVALKPRLSPELLPAAEHILAGELLSAKRTLAALDESTQELPEYQLMRSEIWLIDGDFDRAERALQACIERFPALGIAYNRLGDLTQTRGKLREAVPHYLKAVELSPDDANAYEDLGDLYATLGDLDKADEMYGHAVRIDPRATADEKRRTLRPTQKAAPEPRVGQVHVLQVHLIRHGERQVETERLFGSTAAIEAVALPGKGEFVISGNVGQTLRDAGLVAFSCMRSRAGELGLTDIMRERDLHIHFAEHAEDPKDGASAGVAFLLVAVSAYTGRPIRGGLGATGEITIHGEVKPIGGLREKATAAHLAGLTTIIAPRRNLREGRELPPEIADKLEIIYVDNVAEAIDKALLPAVAK